MRPRSADPGPRAAEDARSTPSTGGLGGRRLGNTPWSSSAPRRREGKITATGLEDDKLNFKIEMEGKPEAPPIEAEPEVTIEGSAE